MPDDPQRDLPYRKVRISDRAEYVPPVHLACTDNQSHAPSHASSSRHRYLLVWNVRRKYTSVHGCTRHFGQSPQEVQAKRYDYRGSSVGCHNLSYY